MTNLVEEKRDVKNFNKIKIRSIANVEITQAEDESVLIEALPSSINKIKTEVEDKTLVIGYTWFGYLWPRKMNVYLKVKHLNGLYAHGAAEVKTGSIKTDKLELRLSGAGKIIMTLESKEIDASISGAGSLFLSGSTDRETLKISGAGEYNAEGFKAQEVKITISGAGSARVNAEQKLDIRISGAGNVYYSGNPQISQNISGAGKIYQI